jgi:hypothetical protein
MHSAALKFVTTWRISQGIPKAFAALGMTREAQWVRGAGSVHDLAPKYNAVVMNLTVTRMASPWLM